MGWIHSFFTERDFKKWEKLENVYNCDYDGKLGIYAHKDLAEDGRGLDELRHNRLI